MPYSDHGARLYSPDQRRWLTPDPLSEKYYGLSPYAYCAGDPVNAVDPDGLDLIFKGESNSSVTFKTDHIDLTVDLEKIGIDFGGDFSFDGEEILSAALDIAGLFDPTGVADAVNATLQASNKQFGAAILSAISVIPGGDIAKVGKVGRDLKILGNALEGASGIKLRSFTKSNFRHNMVAKTGVNPKGMQAHHTLPVKHEKEFLKAGVNIHDPKYGVWMDSHHHLSGAKAYNSEWEQFLLKDAAPTQSQIENEAIRIMDKIYGQ